MDPINEAYMNDVNKTKIKGVTKEIIKRPHGEDISFADMLVRNDLATRNPDGVGITFYKASGPDAYFAFGKTKADAMKNLRTVLAGGDYY